MRLRLFRQNDLRFGRVSRKDNLPPFPCFVSGWCVEFLYKSSHVGWGFRIGFSRFALMGVLYTWCLNEYVGCLGFMCLLGVCVVCAFLDVQMCDCLNMF